MIVTHGRIWEAASKEKTRPILTGVYFDAEKATLTATNSYIAARISCEVEDGDESGLIPAEAVKASATSSAKHRSLRVAKGKATLTLDDGERSWTLIDGAFPVIDDLFVKAATPMQHYGFNAAFLHQVSDALGCNGDRGIPLVLCPDNPLKPMRVENPHREHGGSGLVMPVRLHDYPQGEEEADYLDDDVVLAALRAGARVLAGRRGGRKAVEAFRTVALQVTAEIAGKRDGERLVA